MPIRKLMKCVTSDHLAAEGLFKHDPSALTSCQRECTTRLCMSIQMEQEAYMSRHPEIIAALELFIAKLAKDMKNKLDVFKEANNFFLRPEKVLKHEIRTRLGIGPKEPFHKADNVPFQFNDEIKLYNDLRDIIKRHFPSPPWSAVSTPPSTPNTESSSFLSIVTSDTTQPTPEPTPIPEPTLSETMFVVVSNAVDKAVYFGLNDAKLNYDTAYVEVSKAVEAAMEIPVILIKEDLQELYDEAFKMFELDILEKERIAAEIAWEKRMRKKMKRTLRRQANFVGYETPPTPKSTISSHESYRKPPPKPCRCHPQWSYNRYVKDRFGIYLPYVEHQFFDGNVTVTPAMSWDNIKEEEQEPEETKEDAKSVTSTKTNASTKTNKSVTVKT